MILTFVYPSSHHRTGGVIVLYELANGLVRRGHEVHFVHGPANPYRIRELDDLPPFRFERDVRHHIVDTLADPRLPAGDVVFLVNAPPRLGLRAGIVQGHRMFDEEDERDLFRAPFPKVCVASWLIDVGSRYGVPAEQLWYVPLGIDHDVFTFRIPQDARSYDVAMLAHSHREKGFAVGVKALAELGRRRAGLRAVVFGMAPRPDTLPDCIQYRQALDHPTLVRSIYGQTRVFVQPSFHEGFGYTAVEAMACGCALVTTDNGGSRDYGLPDQTALVVSPGDWAGLAHAAARLLGDDELRGQLASAGSRLVRQRFDWDNSAAVLSAQLEAYIANPEHYQRPPIDVARSAARDETREIRSV